MLTFGEPKQDPGPIYQANRTRPWGVELGFPNYPIRMPIHFLDSKALSSLGVFYLVRILSREPAHIFILQSWKLSQPSSLWKSADGPGSALGFQACPRRRERGCRGGSADLVPTSRPLRSESALGSVVPLPCPPPRLGVTVSPEVHLNQGGGDEQSVPRLGGAEGLLLAARGFRPWS